MLDSTLLGGMLDSTLLGGMLDSTLLGGMLDSTLLAGMSLDDAGANRPGTMRPRPTGEARAEAEREANE